MSLADQYHAREAAKAAQLDQLGDALVGLDPIGPAPTAVHIAAVGMLDRLLELGNELVDGPGEETPMQLRVALQFITRFRPSMLEMFARVPEESVRGFLAAMRDDLNNVLATGDTPEEEASSHGDSSGEPVAAPVGADQPGPDQPPA